MFFAGRLMYHTCLHCMCDVFWVWYVLTVNKLTKGCACDHQVSPNGVGTNSQVRGLSTRAGLVCCVRRSCSGTLFDGVESAVVCKMSRAMCGCCLQHVERLPGGGGLPRSPASHTALHHASCMRCRCRSWAFGYLVPVCTTQQAQQAGSLPCALLTTSQCCSQQWSLLQADGALGLYGVALSTPP